VDGPRFETRRLGRSLGRAIVADRMRRISLTMVALPMPGPHGGRAGEIEGHRGRRSRFREWRHTDQTLISQPTSRVASDPCMPPAAPQEIDHDLLCGRAKEKPCQGKSHRRPRREQGVVTPAGSMGGTARC
jgi:hypothetical protein